MKNIKLPLLRGQKDNRQERIEKYEKFTGAKLDDISVKKAPETPKQVKERFKRDVELQLTNIKHSLEQGVSSVVCTLPSRELYQAVWLKLTPAERKLVQFPPYDVPVPASTVKVED